MQRLIAACAVTLAAAGASAPVAAHHGAGLFEPETEITVTGTVTEFQFVNPHVLIYVAVDGERKGTWGGELTSPNRLARMSGAVPWHKNVLVPGERLTMTGHPARNGAPAMSVTKLVKADGAVLFE